MLCNQGESSYKFKTEIITQVADFQVTILNCPVSQKERTSGPQGVELILKVPFFLTILWDELLSKNLGIFVLCTKMTRLSQELTSVNS